MVSQQDNENEDLRTSNILNVALLRTRRWNRALERIFGGDMAVLTKPWLLLRGEGGAILALSILFYGRFHGGWSWFAVLFLTPDLSMLGYLANQRMGAALYNLVHSLLAPCVLISVGLLAHPKAIEFALIWSAHIGFDRLLGYGLKYPTRFKDTHLQRVR